MDCVTLLMARQKKWYPFTAALGSFSDFRKNCHSGRIWMLRNLTFWEKKRNIPLSKEIISIFSETLSKKFLFSSEQYELIFIKFYSLGILIFSRFFLSICEFFLAEVFLSSNIANSEFWHSFQPIFSGRVLDFLRNTVGGRPRWRIFEIFQKIFRKFWEFLIEIQ